MGLITYENLEDGQKVTANVFNERFAQIVAQLNGNLDESNFANEGISKEKLKAEVYESMYPIGSQYVNFTDSTNPATLLGFGTWQAVAGRVIVGYDATQTEFHAAEKTGGAKTHTNTLGSNGAAGIRNFGVKTYVTDGANSNSLWKMNGTTNNVWGWTHNVDAIETTDMGYAGVALYGRTEDGSSLQPYITAYVWKRIS